MERGHGKKLMRDEMKDKTNNIFSCIVETMDFYMHEEIMAGQNESEYHCTSTLPSFSPPSLPHPIKNNPNIPHPTGPSLLCRSRRRVARCNLPSTWGEILV